MGCPSNCKDIINNDRNNSLCWFDLELEENVLKTNLRKSLGNIFHWSLSTEDNTFTQKFHWFAQFPDIFVFQSRASLIYSCPILEVLTGMLFLQRTNKIELVWVCFSSIFSMCRRRGREWQENTCERINEGETALRAAHILSLINPAGH